MESKAPSRLSDLVRRYRTVAALSQEALAERAGLSVRALSDLERGVHRVPRLETLRMLADGLGLNDADRATLLAAARPQVMDMPQRELERELLVALPTPPTRLIGRETEMAELAALLTRDDVRLVTLTGPGGIGKTHLALTVAGEARERFPDGVCFVDLSPLADPALVVPTIANALGVREITGESPSATLRRFLQHRQLLLVLDNCEQVLEAAAEIAALLLRACPDLVILATSRVPLHIRAEWEVLVAPLQSPDPARLPPLSELSRVATVALFTERARAARADFTLTADNAAAICAICQRLDGLPLALELAAARVNMLSPAALLTRLEQRLPLLTGGDRDLPARQRTMRDTIAWSYDLLRREEQGVFRRLAVFAGGCTLPAAEAVAGKAGTRDIFANVADLIESSMLRQADDLTGEPRFRMLETVREYGLQRLAAAGEEDDARKRHADYFRSLAESQMLGPSLFMNLERIAAVAADQDNLRLALTWFDEHDELETLLQMSTDLYGLWMSRGPYREGIHWIGRALERSPPAPSDTRARALAASGRLAAFAGDLARVAALVADGLKLARELGEPIYVAMALNTAGFRSYRLGDYERAEDQLAEAHRLVSDLADDPRHLGSETYMARLVLGDVALAQEQFERAARRYEIALEAAPPVGTVWGAIDALAGLAGAHLCMGSTGKAAALYEQSLDRARELGVAMLVASSLLGLAGVAVASGRAEDGACLLGAAEGIVTSLGARFFPRDQPVYDRCLTSLTAALGEEWLATERESGRLLTIEHAIARAHAVAAGVGRAEQ